MASGFYVNIAKGSDLVAVAKDCGISDWNQIYDHNRNVGFKKSNPDPHKTSKKYRVWLEGTNKTPGQTFRCKTGEVSDCQLESKRVVPIILVPGIFGSRLKEPSSSPPDERLVWDPDDLLSLARKVFKSSSTLRAELGLNRGALVAARSPSKKTPLPEETLYHDWAGISGKYYGNSLEALSGHEFSRCTTPVYAFGYDWRNSNQESGKKLAGRIARIREEERCEKVLLVTHSMGGLVARACCHDNKGISDRVLAVIHVVEPSTGAPLAFRRFITGWSRKEDSDLGKLFGSTPEKFATVAGDMIGPFELLPTSDYFAPGKAKGAPWLTLLVRQHPWKDVPCNSVFSYYRDPDSDAYLVPVGWRNAKRDRERRWADTLLKRLSTAEEFRKWLGQNAHSHTHLISATSASKNTEVATELHRMGPRQTSPNDVVRDVGPEFVTVKQVYGKGDGTVPTTSQLGHLKKHGGPLPEKCSVCEVAVHVAERMVDHDAVFGPQGNEVIKVVIETIQTILDHEN